MSTDRKNFGRQRTEEGVAQIWVSKAMTICASCIKVLGDTIEEATSGHPNVFQSFRHQSSD